MSLKGVCHVLSGWLEGVAPDEGFAGEAATRGELPLRFGGETLAGPFGIGNCIVIGDVDDGIIFLSLNIAVGAAGMVPVRALDVGPPLHMVVERHGFIG